MRAVHYHADLPYPIVKGLTRNKKQALTLMEGYSGQVSELSTVTQYAYHHLKCLNNKELAMALKGIFLVETHHLELLGDCINQLGADPRYVMYLNQRPISWQADVIHYEDNIRRMILADIEGEKGAVDYYIKAAGEIGNEKIAGLLLRLAEDEKLHVKIFSELYDKHFGRH